MRPSRQFAVTKDEQIAREMARLAKLQQGFPYHFPLDTGIVKAVFGGYCRIENLDSIWAGKIERHIKIAADSFSERDTVGGTHELKPFAVPDGRFIHGVELKNGEIRIVTRQAQGDVLKVHHRMPDLI
jgi:hypothetical protein